MTLELMHPLTLLPGRAGTITIRCRPAEPADVQFYKQAGCGYFRDYTPAASVTASTNTSTTKPLPTTVLVDSNATTNKSAHSGLGLGSSPSVNGDTNSLDNDETPTVATSAPNTPDQQSSRNDHHDNNPTNTNTNAGSSGSASSSSSKGGLVSGFLQTISDAFSASGSETATGAASTGITGRATAAAAGAATRIPILREQVQEGT